MRQRTGARSTGDSGMAHTVGDAGPTSPWRHRRPCAREHVTGRIQPAGSVTQSPAVAPVAVAEGNVAVMRAYAWKVALVAIVFCYPVASLIGRLITYVALK